MIVCGSYMFEFSVSKCLCVYIYIYKNKKENGSREGSGTFMSNTNCQRIKNQRWAGYGGNNTRYDKTLHILLSVVVQVWACTPPIGLTKSKNSIIESWVEVLAEEKINKD